MTPFIFGTINYTNKAYAMLRKKTAQSIPNNSTVAIVFDGANDYVIASRDINVVPSTGVLTINTAGIYIISYEITATGTGTVQTYVWSSPYRYGHSFTTWAGAISQSSIVSLAVGDTLSLMIYGTSRDVPSFDNNDQYACEFSVVYKDVTLTFSVNVTYRTDWC